MRVEGTLKWGGTEQSGGDTKILKGGGGELGHGMGPLKKEGGWNPLTNYGS